MTVSIEVADVTYDIVLKYVDTSFDHGFGTERQGQYELQSVSVAGFDLTEVLQENFVDKLETMAAREVSKD